LLREEPWDVLIVLDACRADVFAEVCQPAEVVRSPFIHTPGWIHRVGPLLWQQRVVYFTANPVVDRECKRHDFHIELVSVWQRLWGRYTEEAIPSVHPLSVNGAVLTWEALGKLRKRKIVVHYLQPHCPYIGAVPLALGRWGGTGGPAGGAFGEACHDLKHPVKAVEQGAADWELVRRAYRANLKLVWHAARQLAAAVPSRRVVVTADHGELLGEDGKFGHEGGYTEYEDLWRVPWLAIERGAIKQESTEQKLEALGYV